MVNLITHKRGQILIVDFETTSILDQHHIEEAGKALAELIEPTDRKHILIDLNRVDFMSSSMIGEFLSFSKKCQSAGIELKFCNLTEDLQEVFQVTNLFEILDVYPTREAAIKAFDLEEAI